MHAKRKQSREATVKFKQHGQEEELSLLQISRPMAPPSLALFQTCGLGALPGQLLEEVFTGSLL